MSALAIIIILNGVRPGDVLMCALFMFVFVLMTEAVEQALQEYQRDIAEINRKTGMDASAAASYESCALNSFPILLRTPHSKSPCLLNSHECAIRKFSVTCNRLAGH